MRFFAIVAALALVACAHAACDVKSLISTNEGYRTCKYIDTMGHPTIGIGFNLDRADAPTLIANVGANYASVRAGTQCLTDAQITTLFNNDVAGAQACAVRVNTFFNTLSAGAKSVVTDLIFNLGCAGYAQFTGFAGFLRNHDYTGAGNDLKTTAWCGQVASRCPRDIACLTA